MQSVAIGGEWHGERITTEGESRIELYVSMDWSGGLVEFEPVAYRLRWLRWVDGVSLPVYVCEDGRRKAIREIVRVYRGMADKMPDEWRYSVALMAALFRLRVEMMGKIVDNA